MESRYDLDAFSGLGNRIDVSPERRFIGFDAYRKAIDCLKPGDLVVDAAVPGFRWVHFRYAIEKGINYFMEKSVAVDGPTCRRMLELARKSVEKNLKVAVGLQTRHCRSRRELLARIQSGEIGEIIAMRAYGLGGAHGPARKPEGISELLWQIQNFPRFFWTSGGGYCDYYVHQVDECCWMKGAWPISVQATGGRHYLTQGVDQNFDNYAAEYTFPDGAKCPVATTKTPATRTARRARRSLPRPASCRAGRARTWARASPPTSESGPSLRPSPARTKWR
jgi:predicted dehydrogenase